MDNIKRVMLKLSGEALTGDKKTGLDAAVAQNIAKQVKKLLDKGYEVGITIGGGNFWRGRDSGKIDRSKADAIGMLATVMNCIYVSETFRSEGMRTQVLTPFECGSFTKSYSKDRANKYFAAGMVVFFAGGTGHPYFSTDMGTVLRAVEVNADVILLAKSVDGVYDSDPSKNPGAKKYDSISYGDIIDNRLGVIDLAAAVLAMENKMPMFIFGLNNEDGIINAVESARCGTMSDAKCGAAYGENGSGNFGGTAIIV